MKHCIIATTALAAAAPLIGAPQASATPNAPALQASYASSAIAQYLTTLGSAATSVNALSPKDSNRLLEYVTPQLLSQTIDNWSNIRTNDNAIVKGMYDRSSAKAKVLDVSQNGTKATVKVHQTVSFHFTGGDDSLESATEEYSNRTYSFVLAGGTWLLSNNGINTEDPADNLKSPSYLSSKEDTPVEVSLIDPTPISTGPTQPSAAGSTPHLSPSVSTPPAQHPSLSRAFNVSSAVKYALAHGDPGKHNSWYKTFDEDCTNFLSQIMHDGGWAWNHFTNLPDNDNHNWFYDPRWYGADYSHSWTVAGDFYQFAIVTSKRAYLLPGRSSVSTGDIIQARWAGRHELDHSMFVTKMWNGVPCLTYHSNDTVNMPLTTIESRNHGAAYWYLRAK